MSIDFEKLEMFEKEHYAGLCIECIRIDIGQTQDSLCRLFGIDPVYYKRSVVLSKDLNEIDICVVFKLYYFSKALSENIYIEKWTRARSLEVSKMCNEAIEEYMNRDNDHDYLPSVNRIREPIENEE